MVKIAAPASAYSGWCARCQTTHQIPLGPAKAAAKDLMRLLDREKHLDYHLPPDKADQRLSTDYLFGKARGKMFGVMVCQRPDGHMLTLKAFSGQYNGIWEVDGWVPPLFDLSQWHAVNDDTERAIKAMGVEIEALGPASDPGRVLVKKRAALSRGLMKALHEIYRLHNFRGECCTLLEAYSSDNGIPNGTADCCGPKMLNYAACHHLRPLGLAEFYYGRSSKRGNRTHGQFYPSCQDKCAPILGYMLCGLKRSNMSG